MELEHFFSDIFIFLKLMLNFVIPNLVHDRWFGHQFILILTEKLKKMTREMYVPFVACMSSSRATRKWLHVFFVRVSFDLI